MDAIRTLTRELVGQKIATDGWTRVNEKVQQFSLLPIDAFLRQQF